MKRNLPGATLVVIVFGLLLASGCSSPPTRFYVLSAQSEAAPGGEASSVAIGVGPLELPDYLDRPQIVTRSGQNELHLAEFDSWAEPLQDNVIQVLAENLASLLHSKRITLYPWKHATPIDLQVVVKVTRFDRTEGGDAVLSTRWTILSADGTKELISRESRYNEHATGAATQATVAALNRTLAQFSREVAGAIISQVNGSPPPR